MKPEFSPKIRIMRRPQSFNGLSPTSASSSSASSSSTPSGSPPTHAARSPLRRSFIAHSPATHHADDLHDDPTDIGHWRPSMLSSKSLDQKDRSSDAKADQD
eukprot:jgi/Hompol1/5633/HPOL_001999-RA